MYANGNAVHLSSWEKKCRPRRIANLNEGKYNVNLSFFFFLLKVKHGTISSVPVQAFKCLFNPPTNNVPSIKDAKFMSKI